MMQDQCGATGTSRLEEAARWVLQRPHQDSPDPALEAWLGADATNREAYEKMAAALDAVERFAGAPEMASLRGAALVLARRSRRMRRIRAFFFSRIGVAASVAAAIIFLGVMFAWLGIHSHTYSTVVGERRSLALTDGSRLSLDAATRVIVDYSAHYRRLTLKRGRARFDVVKDPLRPFTVEADGKVVVATGTSFSVELLEDQFHVVLYEGRVEVLRADARPTSGGDSGERGHWTLSSGKELAAPRAARGGPVRVAAVDVARTTSWESGDLAFAGEPLGLAVERVNRYSNRRVRVPDPAAAAVRISGVFHAGDTAAFIDGVTSAFPIRAEREPDGATKLVLRK